MPEGHTIHRVARDHNQRFAGQKLEVSSPQGRFESGAAELDGKRLIRVEAYGKHLFYHWEENLCLHIHLGLYGKFRLHKCPPPEPRGAVRVRMVGQQHAFDLNGPTACDLVAQEARESILARLGQDPLREDGDFESLWRRVQRSRSPIGALLLNQSVFAGVGNVYRAELLFDAGIDPRRPANEISREQYESLWERLVQWLQIGVKYNRIITADPPKKKPRSRMNRQERLLCYKKSNCPRCKSAIDKFELGGRTIYACLNCQT